MVRAQLKDDLDEPIRPTDVGVLLDQQDEPLFIAACSGAQQS